MNVAKIVLRARLDEAKIALRNIPHHLDCPARGFRRHRGEPATCFQGKGDQGPCSRIFQWKRIRHLERSLKEAKG